jgi:Holliday junction resolvase
LSQRESNLSRKIMAVLRLEGAFVFKVWGSEHMMAGLPDLIGCYEGKFFGFEVKVPENRKGATAIQLRIQQKIRDAGGISHIICTPQEALRFLGIDE